MKRLSKALLALALLLAAVPVRADDEEKLTDAETREACDLAREFVERLRENNDVEPLVKDLFVRDFVARLRHERENIPMVFVEPSVAERARDTASQVRLLTRAAAVAEDDLNLIARPQDNDENEDGECNDLCQVEKLYPPEVFRVLKEDPIFAGMMAQEKANHDTANEGERTTSSDVADAESKPQPKEEETYFVKSLVMLPAATATTVKAAEALRAYTPEFSALRRAQEESGREDILEEVHEPRLETYENEHFGFPPGTRFVRIHVEPAYDIEFELTLVMEDGRLRILFATPILGD